jgi:ribonuclease T1
VVSSRKSRVVISVVLGVAVIVGFLVWTWTRSSSTSATSSIDSETGLPWIEVAALPSQGRAVLALIDKGGPYPYSQDGGTFTNAERLLPLKAKGFYTEYTVKLPSSSDRGPVRIIMGGKGQWYFWTDDHYASFSRIRR